MNAWACWDDLEETLIRVHLAGDWTWQELWSALESAWSLADSVDHPVALVFSLDEAAARRFPCRSLLTDTHIADSVHHPHIALYMAVTPDHPAYVRFVTDALNAVMPGLHTLSHVTTLAEARKAAAGYLHPTH